jgi:predicted transcriptional regulator
MDATPQEIEVWYILPGLRKEITVALKNEHLKQKEIASLLGITESAVSQYLKAKRAKSVLFGSDIQNQIKESAIKLKEHSSSIQNEIQKLLSLVRDSKLICKKHKEFSAMPENCDICLKQCRR